MKAVILAAGFGTRMKVLVKNLPKPMITVLNKPIIQYKLDILPSNISEVIIVIGHQGDKIKRYFGNFYNGKKISYIIDQSISGTAKALWQARHLLTGRFLVIMGDDLYDSFSVSECCKYDWSICCKVAEREEKYSRVILNENGNISNFVTAKNYRSNYNDGGLIFTGLYSMTDEIFKYKPVKMKTKNEWGLPQTLLRIAKNHKIKIIKTNFWIPISSPEDLKTAEIELRKNTKAYSAS